MAAYASSLGSNGQIYWTQCNAEIVHQQSNVAEIALKIDFPNIDWHRLQQIYGWAALQYQAWARGELIIGWNKPQIVVLYTDSILEYAVDDKPYFGGDCYAYRRAPLVLSLLPGSHKIELRIVRDVRIMGGTDSTTSICLRVERSEGGLVVLEKKLLISDVVNGALASPYAAVPLRNDGKISVSVRKVEAVKVSAIWHLILQSTFTFYISATELYHQHIRKLASLHLGSRPGSTVAFSLGRFQCVGPDYLNEGHLHNRWNLHSSI